MDIIGSYMNPPENAVVLCIDEKSQIQALGPRRACQVRCVNDVGNVMVTWTGYGG